ncbi:helix-turn-helix transcriptional regulator [Pelagicoccus mobilis]|uniref:Helix-turn-helix transcriptional regulator n=1 Tax=Pelagicoccus mobilis TaxID=415221 RepID=A0A934S0K5_9BACT|nr:helix-turn-helix transcriptional regulator [Pelagicoccus mobilis]
MKKLGANIRAARSNRGMTQEGLAELAELNARTVQKIEAGETNILTSTLVRIRKGIGCDYDALLKGLDGLC